MAKWYDQLEKNYWYKFSSLQQGTLHKPQKCDKILSEKWYIIKTRILKIIRYNICMSIKLQRYFSWYTYGVCKTKLKQVCN